MADACRCESHGPGLPVEKGELARITGVFTDLETGAAVDPSAVRFLFRVRGDANATMLVYGENEELVRDEAGVYHFDVPTDQSGPVYYRWESDEGRGVSEGQVSVRPSVVA